MGTLLEQLGDAQGMGAFDAAVVRETRRYTLILQCSVVLLKALCEY